MFARSLDPRLHKPVVVGLQAFFNPQSALASQAGCRARVCVGVEIEPMFSVEAKKRMLSGVKDPDANLRQGQRTDIVANLRQCKAKASDQAADVCGVSSRMVQRA